MKNLCVFCGSSSGKDSNYLKDAKELGQKMAQSTIGLVYGGASIGVMGAIANSVLKNSGKAYGVIPQKLIDMEVAHKNLTELKIVKSMHERKQMMYDLSDGFVALPGGMGTLDEFCEIITWAQLKYHHKPCWILNLNGFYDSLIEHFNKINAEFFLSDEHRSLIRVVNTTDELLQEFKQAL